MDATTAITGRAFPLVYARRAYEHANRAQQTSAPAQVRKQQHAEILPSKAQRLVAARVQGGIDFHHRLPSAQGVLQFYRRPADQNAASTGVQVGRSLDVTG